MSRRFIAGARCQGCGAEDTLFVESGAPADLVHCVACSYQAARPQSGDNLLADKPSDEKVLQVIEIISPST